MPFCRSCGDFMFSEERHTCPPAFLCRIDDRGYEDGDEIEVHARDAESAAEKFCDEYDSGGDYTIISAGQAMVKVTDPRSGVSTFWDIVAESVPSYTAYARDSGSDPKGEDAPAAECEASQSGGSASERIVQTPSSPPGDQP